MNGLEKFLDLPEEAEFEIEFLGSRVVEFMITSSKYGTGNVHTGIINLKEEVKLPQFYEEKIKGAGINRPKTSKTKSMVKG